MNEHIEHDLKNIGTIYKIMSMERTVMVEKNCSIRNVF